MAVKVVDAFAVAALPQLAERPEITFYDASYLWFAAEL